MRATLFLLGASTVGAAVLDSAATGYYTASGDKINALPSNDYTGRPSTISYEGLAELHDYCVDRINKYRSGALKFGDGTADSNVQAGLTALRGAQSRDTCSNEQAMGDLFVNVQNGGGCAGAHATAFKCGFGGSQGQNSCCGRGDGSWGSWNTAKHLTVDSVKKELDGCLQQMWDEGITAGQKGHWETMRSTTFTDVSCGFAWTKSGRVMMNQDFNNKQACSSSCDSKSCGAEDGCTGTCQASNCDGTTAVTPPTPQPTPQPTPSPTTAPATDTGAGIPDESAMKCAGGQFKDCKGWCWSPYDLISSKVGNGICNDWSAYGLDMNCQRLNCDGGDCGSTCAPETGALGEDVDVGGLPQLGAPATAEEDEGGNEEASSASLNLPSFVATVGMIGAGLQL